MTALAYRPDIDGLRTVAIVPVVLFHAGVPFMAGGYVGVDVFFVLSGYLMSAIILREMDAGTFSLLKFYERRARRILPALLFVIAGTLAASAFILLPLAYARLGESMIAAILFYSNVHFFLNSGYFSAAAEFEPLLHTWSLAVEEQFYIVFPLFLLLATRQPFRRFLPALMLAIIAVSLVLSVIAVDMYRTAAFYLTPFRIWELGAGAILATFAVPRVARPVVRELLALVAILAIVVPIFAYSPDTAFPGLAAIPPVLGTAVLIAIGRDTNMVSRILSARPFVLIGLISYSLYLWHWPIFALLRSNKLSLHLSAGEAVFGVVASIALAVFSYRFVEQPFRKRRLLGEQKPLLTASLASLVAVSIVGAVLYGAGGFPARVPVDAARFEAATIDSNPVRDDCINTFPADGLCVVGSGIDGYVRNDSGADILLWGDSHADALVPAFAQAADQSDKRVALATHDGCAPVVRLLNAVWPARSPCERFNESVLDMLRSSDRYPTIVLSARWALLAEGTRFGEERGKDVTLQWPDPLVPVAATPRGNPALLEAALVQTVNAIEETGRKVVLIGPTPEAGFDVPLRLAQAQRNGMAYPGGPDAAQVTQRNSSALAILRRASAATGARYIDLLGPLCPRGCPILIDGVPIYVDDDHLSKTAAEWLVTPHLASVFE